ncbi:MAG TPA: aspartyl protease family protein [Phycisphaerae bacterium]|jgi:clan AA aspartic protease|nr:aspartyl protease family protein [Phycisphaerae bacterium]
MTILNSAQEVPVGRFSVELELANDEDLLMSEQGLLKPDQVRRVKVRGVVDTGATRLVIPQAVASHLGLAERSSVIVRFADGRSATRPVVERLRVTCEGRTSVFNAIVEPNRDSALIGAIVLEDLDFLVDPKNGRLVPRDPAGIVSEVE